MPPGRSLTLCILPSCLRNPPFECHRGPVHGCWSWTHSVSVHFDGNKRESHCGRRHFKPTLSAIKHLLTSLSLSPVLFNRQCFLCVPTHFSKGMQKKKKRLFVQQQQKKLWTLVKCLYGKIDGSQLPTVCLPAHICSFYLLSVLSCWQLVTLPKSFVLLKSTELFTLLYVILVLSLHIILKELTKKFWGHVCKSVHPSMYEMWFWSWQIWPKNEPHAIVVDHRSWLKAAPVCVYAFPACSNQELFVSLPQSNGINKQPQMRELALMHVSHE